MKKKILVCGATGFIGHNIAESFAELADIELYGTYFKSKPLSDPRITMVYADLTNKADVEKVITGMDVIVQAAAVTSGSKDIQTRPYIHITDNAVMNSLILRAAWEQSVSHLVFFSCTNMYQSSDVPVKETDFDASEEMFSTYFGIGWTKVYIEKMCEFYSRLGRTKFTVIRHSNIYGPYDKFDLERSHVFGATINKVMSAPEGGKLTVWGSGDEERDLLYVSDLVDFVKLAISKQEVSFELYNAGYDSSISVNDLVRKIIILSGKNLSVENDLSKPSIKTKLCLDSAKAKQELGWTANVSLDEGIRKTLAWYKTKYQYV